MLLWHINTKRQGQHWATSLNSFRNQWRIDKWSSRYPLWHSVIWLWSLWVLWSATSTWHQPVSLGAIFKVRPPMKLLLPIQFPQLWNQTARSWRLVSPALACDMFIARSLQNSSNILLNSHRNDIKYMSTFGVVRPQWVKPRLLSCLQFIMLLYTSRYLLWYISITQMSDIRHGVWYTGLWQNFIFIPYQGRTYALSYRCL